MMRAALAWLGTIGTLSAVFAASLAGCGDDEDTTQLLDQTDAGADAYVIVLDGGGEVAEPPDGPAACPMGACNYQTGEGCSAGKPSCVPLPNATDMIEASCTAAGTGKSGDDCVEWSDCAAGYVCAEKECHKLCCGGDWTGCPSEDEHCIVALKLGSSQAEAVDTGAMLCYEVNTCDPLAPASCTKPDTTCQIVDPTGASACVTEGTGEHGEECPCKGGFLCDKVLGTCRRLCKAVEGGGEPACKPGEGACVHYAKHPAGVGECVD